MQWRLRAGASPPSRTRSPIRPPIPMALTRLAKPHRVREPHLARLLRFTHLTFLINVGQPLWTDSPLPKQQEPLREGSTDGAKGSKHHSSKRKVPCLGTSALGRRVGSRSPPWPLCASRLRAVPIEPWA